MVKSKTRSMIGVLILVAIFLIAPTNALTAGASKSVLQSSAPPPIPCRGGGSNIYWGVDSVDDMFSQNPTLLSQVQSQLGSPGIIGRYLNDGGTLLTSTETSKLIGDGIALVLYYSPANTALTGTGTADTESTQAVAEAKNVGAMPHTGVAIYRDMEPPPLGYTINSAYITRWYQDLSSAGYTAGFYEDSYSGPFENQFCAASANAIANTFLQTPQLQQPQDGYTEAAAPTTYNPYHVACESLSQMMGWQYLEGDLSPHVDVDEYSITGTYE